MMSSFPKHEENIRELESMGFDVSEAIENGKVAIESWGYDDLTYLLGDIITVLRRQNFKVKKGGEVMSELVSKELVQEIVECVQTCNWSCQEEIECYIHSTLNDTEEYEPEDWLYGKGEKWLEAQND